MPVSRIIVAKPRGFCAGVEMATKALAFLTNAYDGPVYCFHEIVHNRSIVEIFESRGVVFVNDIAEVPAGAPIMLSAHGSAPQVVASAKANGGIVVDAVCPLVTKVHHELKVRASKGYTVIYVGHEGHDEAVGTMAVAPENVLLVEKPEQVEGLNLKDQPLALLAQTTLAEHEWKDVHSAVEGKFGEVWTPGRSDLCFATTNRQEAIRQIAKQCDAVIVLGSENSSNTVALAKTAKEFGAPVVYRINDVNELPPELSGVIGLTAGASAPETLVQSVIDVLSPSSGVDEVTVTDEDEYFPIPRDLRDFVQALRLLASGAFASNESETQWNDREVSASDVLSTLAG